MIINCHTWRKGNVRRKVRLGLQAPGSELRLLGEAARTPAPRRPRSGVCRGLRGRPARGATRGTGPSAAAHAGARGGCGVGGVWAGEWEREKGGRLLKLFFFLTKPSVAGANIGTSLSLSAS